MKSLLLLPLFLLLSTSFKESKLEPKLIGTMEFWLEGDRFVYLTYRGDYPYCYMKYAIDDLFKDCDTIVLYRLGYEATFPGLHIIPIDTAKVDSVPKTIEIKRI